MSYPGKKEADCAHKKPIPTDSQTHAHIFLLQLQHFPDVGITSVLNWP